MYEAITREKRERCSQTNKRVEGEPDKFADSFSPLEEVKSDLCRLDFSFALNVFVETLPLRKDFPLG